MCVCSQLMADASLWKISTMDTWDWNVVEWTSLGLVTLAETALLVPVWEYLALALVLTSIWLYRFLDFHFVDDLLHGFRGDVPRLHHSLISKLTTDVLPKCKILKQRYMVKFSREIQTCKLWKHYCHLIQLITICTLEICYFPGFLWGNLSVNLTVNEASRSVQSTASLSIPFLY